MFVNNKLQLNETSSYRIFNKLGKLITFGENQNKINISSLKKGVYTIELRVNNKVRYERFIKE